MKKPATQLGRGLSQKDFAGTALATAGQILERDILIHADIAG
jgi:hypothetical protein